MEQGAHSVLAAISNRGNLSSRHPAMHSADIDALIHPTRLFSRREVLAKDCPVPRKPGVYAWYFRQVPSGVPVNDCHRLAEGTLLYVGISPKRPPLNGGSLSSQRLFHRVRYHFQGNAEGSTLRLTLGCLLTDELGIQLRRVGSGMRLTFTMYGESRLSEWMEENALVAWRPVTEPWLLEEELIRQYSLPLNLEHNESHPFHSRLRDIRRTCRDRARSLPVCDSSA